jgi:predicted amidophosphoribosyltransferase
MFENIGKAFADVGNSIKKGTQSFSETVSLNSRIDECKKELDNCFLQLGHNFYEKNRTSVPEEYKGIFDNIDLLNRTIIQCQDQIKVIKGIRQCPKCGADVAANVMFCGNCGYSMPPAQAAKPAPSGPVCPSCGAPLEPDALFCTSCGAKLQAAAQPTGGFEQNTQNYSYSQPVYEQPTQQVQQPYGEPARSEEPAEPEQPVPEAPVQEKTSFAEAVTEAPVTEQPAEEAPSVEEPAAEESSGEEIPVPEQQPVFEEPEQQPVFEQQAPADKICPRCGTRLASDAAFCNNCGESLLGMQQGQGAYAQAPVQERYCPNCGTRLEEDALFCAECGTKVG